jgi:uncharacterized repeat protein (TIGR03803 family)
MLHDFGSREHDGVNPNGPLVFDAAGNLYGATVEGGEHNSGTVFELSPTAAGGWVETVLYNFFDRATERGSLPTGSVIFDAAGNLYGTAYGGGANSRGAVFELSPRASGSWTLKCCTASLMPKTEWIRLILWSSMLPAISTA